jgi:hypothetical protein
MNYPIIESKAFGCRLREVLFCDPGGFWNDTLLIIKGLKVIAL